MTSSPTQQQATNEQNCVEQPTCHFRLGMYSIFKILMVQKFELSKFNGLGI